LTQPLILVGRDSVEPLPGLMFSGSGSKLANTGS